MCAFRWLLSARHRDPPLHHGQLRTTRPLLAVFVCRVTLSIVGAAVAAGIRQWLTTRVPWHRSKRLTLIRNRLDPLNSRPGLAFCTHNTRPRNIRRQAMMKCAKATVLQKERRDSAAATLDAPTCQRKLDSTSDQPDRRLAARVQWSKIHLPALEKTYNVPCSCMDMSTTTHKRSRPWPWPQQVLCSTASWQA